MCTPAEWHLVALNVTWQHSVSQPWVTLQQYHFRKHLNSFPIDPLY